MTVVNHDPAPMCPIETGWGHRVVQEWTLLQTNGRRVYDRPQIKYGNNPMFGSIASALSLV